MAMHASDRLSRVRFSATHADELTWALRSDLLRRTRTGSHCRTGGDPEGVPACCPPPASRPQLPGPQDCGRAADAKVERGTQNADRSEMQERIRSDRDIRREPGSPFPGRGSAAVQLVAIGTACSRGLVSYHRGRDLLVDPVLSRRLWLPSGPASDRAATGSGGNG